MEDLSVALVLCVIFLNITYCHERSATRAHELKLKGCEIKSKISESIDDMSSL